MALLTLEKVQEGIVQIKLNRPDKRNALNIALLKELIQTLETLANSSHRVLLLSGEGSVFCAGMDLEEAANPKLVQEIAEKIRDTLKALYHAPQVTIAAVQGAAIAGGAGLMIACDFAIAAEDVKIGFPEVRRGLVAALVGTLLHRQLRLRDVRELLLTGSLIGSKRAYEMGMINQIVPSAELQPTCLAFAKEIFLGSPNSLKNSKKFLDEFYASSLDEELDTALLYSRDASYSADAQEGIRAFLEKREPHWS